MCVSVSHTIVLRNMQTLTSAPTPPRDTLTWTDPQLSLHGSSHGRAEEHSTHKREAGRQVGTDHGQRLPLLVCILEWCVYM